MYTLILNRFGIRITPVPNSFNCSDEKYAHVRILTSCSCTLSGTSNAAEEALSQSDMQNFGLKHERKALLGDLDRKGRMI
jgi:hypothetical protein